MDIKDVSEIPLVVVDPGRPARAQTPDSSLETTLPAPTINDTVEFETARDTAVARAPQALESLNSTIGASNLATETLEKIGGILEDIQEIAADAAQPSVSDDSVQVLQETARSLRDEIVKSVSRDPLRGTNPVLDDSIRLELERTLGKTLEMILPTQSSDAFGFDAVSLSPKDLILNTVAKVEAARKGIEELRSKLSANFGVMSTQVAELGRGAQRPSLQGEKLRDINEVSIKTQETSDDILAQPELALGVLGDIQRRAPSLLL